MAKINERIEGGGQSKTDGTVGGTNYSPAPNQSVPQSTPAGEGVRSVTPSGQTRGSPSQVSKSRLRNNKKVTTAERRDAQQLQEFKDAFPGEISPNSKQSSLFRRQREKLAKYKAEQARLKAEKEQQQRDYEASLVTVTDSKGQTRQVDPKTGRIVKETIKVKEDRYRNQSGGKYEIIRSADGKLATFEPKVTRNENIGQGSGAAYVDTIGGEAIQSTGSTGGREYIITESGKTYYKMDAWEKAGLEAERKQSLPDQWVEYIPESSTRSADERKRIEAQQVYLNLPENQRSMIELLTLPPAAVDAIGQKTLDQSIQDRSVAAIETASGSPEDFYKPTGDPAIDSLNVKLAYVRNKERIGRDVAGAAADWLTLGLGAGVKGVTKAPVIIKSITGKGKGVSKVVQYGNRAGYGGLTPPPRLSNVIRRKRTTTDAAYGTSDTFANTKTNTYWSYNDLVITQRLGQKKQRTLIVKGLESGKGEVQDGIINAKADRGVAIAYRVVKNRKKKVSTLKEYAKYDLEASKFIGEQTPKGYTGISQTVMKQRGTRKTYVSDASRVYGSKTAELDAKGITKIGQEVIEFDKKTGYLVMDQKANITGSKNSKNIISSNKGSNRNLVKSTVYEKFPDEGIDDFAYVQQNYLTAPKNAYSTAMTPSLAKEIAKKASSDVGKKRNQYLTEGAEPEVIPKDVVSRGAVRQGKGMDSSLSPEARYALLGGSDLDVRSLSQQEQKKSFSEKVMSEFGLRKKSRSEMGIKARQGNYEGYNRKDLVKYVKSPASGYKSIQNQKQSVSQAPKLQNLLRTPAKRQAPPSRSPRTPSYRPPTKFRPVTPIIKLNTGGKKKNENKRKQKRKGYSQYRPSLTAEFVDPLKKTPKWTSGVAPRPFVKKVRRKKAKKRGSIPRMRIPI